LPEFVAGNNHLEQTKGVSSLPKIFDVAYHIVKASTDILLIEKTYMMLMNYLDWWYKERYDSKTG